MKKNIYVSLLTLFVLSVLACGGSKKESGVRTIKLGHTGSPEHPYQIYSQRWADEVTRLTDGRYIFEIFPSDLYGTQNQLVEGCQLGTADMVLTSDSVLATFDKQVGVFTLPFLFKNVNQAYEVFNSDIGDDINKGLAKKNLIVIGWWENGIRHIYTKKPVTKLSDLKGMKIRTPGAPEMVDTFNALGASAVPMGFGEVYTALQLGTIDGAEGPTTHLITQKYYEIIKNAALVYYAHVAEPLVMSKKLWDTISKEDKEIFIKVGKDVSTFAFDYYKNLEEQEMKQAEGYGVKFTVVDTTDFQKAVEPVYAKYRNQYGTMLDRILEKTSGK